MAVPLADPADLAAMWRPLSAAEETVAESLVQVASALIRRKLPSIDTWIADGTLDNSIVLYVVTEMIKAAVEFGDRPAGAKSVSESMGPFTIAVTYDAVGRLSLTDDLLALLAPEKTEPRIASIRLFPALGPHLHTWPRYDR